MAARKPLPGFRSDAEAEDFVATADLTEYELSGGVPVRYEFRPKAASISMRVPQVLLDAVKEEAAKDGLPYQRFIRLQLEAAIAARRKKAG